MGTPIITVQNMSFGYGKEDILTDVNFIVEEQEYVGIIGANGAGKSTLMKLLLGQLTPSRGEVVVETKSIGYVPQVGFHAINNFPANVEEVAMTGLHAEIGMFHFPKKEHRQRVRQSLELVGMQDYRKRMLSELSGGQQQRVMIARALVQNPKLLVLDEPLTGIDQEAGEVLYRLLDKLNKEYGMTIVMVTHNMEQVARYTNRFYHVRNGNVHLDKSSILCDEVLKDKMIISKPRRYSGRHSGSVKAYPNMHEKEAPYDASYKGAQKKSFLQASSYEDRQKESSPQVVADENGKEKDIMDNMAHRSSSQRKDTAEESVSVHTDGRGEGDSSC